MLSFPAALLKSCSHIGAKQYGAVQYVNNVRSVQSLEIEEAKAALKL